MVTAKTQYSLTNAKDYFTEHLCVGDYYEEGQRVAGQWFGLGAERLGLAGKVQAEDFLRLCENQHPSTGETLTQRLKGTRIEHGQVAANRRIFYDFTFSPPKSVSLAAFLGNDERIINAHVGDRSTAGLPLWRRSGADDLRFPAFQPNWRRTATTPAIGRCTDQ